MTMNTYKVTITDTATYVIRASSQEKAEAIAQDFFDERKPTIDTVITNNLIPETTIVD